MSSLAWQHADITSILLPNLDKTRHLFNSAFKAKHCLYLSLTLLANNQYRLQIERRSQQLTITYSNSKCLGTVIGMSGVSWWCECLAAEFRLWDHTQKTLSCRTVFLSVWMTAALVYDERRLNHWWCSSENYVRSTRCGGCCWPRHQHARCG